MTSSMQRRFTGRKSSGLSSMGDIPDREEFFKNQSVAVSKAISPVEAPVKAKHLRLILLGTHQERGCGTFFASIHRIQLESNRHLSWKFCHVLHKILREGHPNVLLECVKYKTKIKDLGQMWCHLKNDVYGGMIKQYTSLLLCKIKFHQNNRQIAGSLQLSDEEMSALGAQDVNNWFELAVEMLDYLDECIALQTCVFNSMDMSRANSLTTSGQCRLAPLILCIMDCSCLYDYVVKCLFKLHNVLPPDVLVGHRDRFNKVFGQLKKFYYTSSNLQYFKYLVTIPQLPDNPPNFLQASDFDNYVPSHAVALDAMSETGSDDTQSVATLVDLGGAAEDVQSTSASVDNAQNGTAHSDQLVQSLQQDLNDARVYVQKLNTDCQQRIEQYENRILQLEHELSASRDMTESLAEECERNREQADRLQNERNQQSIATAQLEITQKTASAHEEKFKKMKDVYNKLRTEHIDTLRKLGEIQKQLVETNGAADQSHTAMQQLQAQLSSVQTQLDASALELEQQKNEFARQLTAQSDDLFGSLCTAGVNALSDTADQFDNPAHVSVLCTPEFLSSRLPPAVDCLNRLRSELFTAEIQQNGNMTGDVKPSTTKTAATKTMCGCVLELCTRISQVALHAQATAHDAPSSHANATWSALEPTFDECAESLRVLSECMDSLLGRAHGDIQADQLGSLIEQEMKQMDAAIKMAADRIQIIINKSRETNTGVRLEVNNSILSSCTELMAAVQELVRRARDLQNEIVAQGRGTGSVLDFYKRNHQWTEGLLSAAKSIGLGANVLVEAADRVISGSGKFEELLVASREIAASTAQLVVSSKVKADRDSACLSAVSKASKTVGTATATVIGTVKAGQETLDETVNLDFSQLTMHQAKQAEFEAQVRVMELETKLVKERQLLGELRKRHYQLNDEQENALTQIKYV